MLVPFKNVNKNFLSILLFLLNAIFIFGTTHIFFTLEIGILVTCFLSIYFHKYGHINTALKWQRKHIAPSLNSQKTPHRGILAKIGLAIATLYTVLFAAYLPWPWPLLIPHPVNLLWSPGCWQFYVHLSHLTSIPEIDWDISKLGFLGHRMKSPWLQILVSLHSIYLSC